MGRFFMQKESSIMAWRAGIQLWQIGVIGLSEKRGLVDVGSRHAYHSGFAHPIFRTTEGMSARWIGRLGPMDKKKLEVFKKRLEERQRELRQAMTRTAQDGR